MEMIIEFEKNDKWKSNNISTFKKRKWIQWKKEIKRVDIILKFSRERNEKKIEISIFFVLM